MSASDETLHPSARKVAVALRALGVTGEVREFTQPTKTSQDAATALGCELAAIASCLVFVADDDPVVIIKSGAHRVDTTGVAGALSVAILRQASPDEVRAATGQPIGGVAPVNWPTAPRVYIDETLAACSVIWSAAGTPNAVFETTFDELVSITGAQPISIVATS